MSVLKRWDGGSGWFAIREFLSDNAAQQHKPAGSAHRHFRHAIVVPAKGAGNRRMETCSSYAGLRVLIPRKMLLK